MPVTWPFKDLSVDGARTTGGIGVLRVEPGDIVVIQVQEKLMPGQAKVIKQRIKELLGDEVGILVLSDGASIQVLRPASEQTGGS